MSNNRPALPGLERLISVLKAHGADLALRPPSLTAPRAGEMIAGAPLDPLLAAVYSRTNGAILGDMVITKSESQEYGLVEENEDCRRGFDPRIQDLFIYGSIQGLAYNFATVPFLAGSDGIQPVIYMDINEPPPYLTFWPIASSVDRAFELYALYTDERIKVCGSLTDRPPLNHDFILFPDSVVKHIARDHKLVEMLQEDRFKQFVAPEPDSQAWVESILKEARALH